MAITPQSEAYLCAIEKIIDPGSDEEHLRVLAAIKAYKAASKVHARLLKTSSGLPSLATACRVHSVLPAKGDGLFAAIAAFNDGSARLSSALRARSDKLGSVLNCLEDQLWIPAVSRLVDGAEKTIKTITAAAENFHGRLVQNLDACGTLLEECKVLPKAERYLEARKKVDATRKALDACAAGPVPIKTLQKIFSPEDMAELQTLVSAAQNEAAQFKKARNSGLMDLQARLEAIEQERAFALSLVNESLWKKHIAFSAVGSLIFFLFLNSWQCFPASLWTLGIATASNVTGSRKLGNIHPPIRYEDERARPWSLYPALALFAFQVGWSFLLGIKSLFASLKPGWSDSLFPPSVLGWFCFLGVGCLVIWSSWNLGAGLYYRSVSKGGREELEKLDGEKLKVEQKIAAL
jgi:hypothetical protein